MATVLELVIDALVTVKALAVGETPGADMTTDALTKFNEILEALSIQNLAVFSNVTTTIPLTVGVGSYSIGPTGAAVVPRPSDITAAFVTYAGVDFPLDQHSENDYAYLALKSQPGLPSWYIYSPDYPNGTIILWPVPAQPSTLTVYQSLAFTAAATLIDQVALPPGYRKMIRLLLAWELASDYPGMTAAELQKLEGDAKAAVSLVKRVNDQPTMLSSEVASLNASGGGDWGNWRTGA